jgi:twitching motility protein PilT
MAYIDQFFELLVAQGASDLHIGEGEPPKIRRHGDIMPIRTEPVTRTPDTRTIRVRDVTR